MLLTLPSFEFSLHAAYYVFFRGSFFYLQLAARAAALLRTRPPPLPGFETGELQCFPGRCNSSHHATERGQDSHRVQVTEEAKHVRAVIWPVGRKTLGEAQPQEACEILEERHRQKHPVNSQTQSRLLNVGEIEYTQASIKAEFRDGRPLTQLISDLHRGKVDPWTCRTLELEVVEYGGKLKGYRPCRRPLVQKCVKLKPDIACFFRESCVS